MIRAENLSYHYPRNRALALSTINLEIEPGDYIAIIGPNGCGKTTLAKHFNALLFPTAGSIWIDRMNTADSTRLPEIRQRVGMVFQNPDQQIVGTTVEEDVAFGPGNLGLSAGEIRKRVDENLAVVGMTQYARRSPHTLSGGEKRLLSIAGVLAMNPQYIIFDEPTAYLDPFSRQVIFNTIKKLNRQGMGIIHITHNTDEILEAGKVMVMDEGRIIFQGTPRDVFRRVEWLKTLRLGVPKINELMWHLKKVDDQVRTDVLTLEEALLEIGSFKKRLGPPQQTARAEKGEIV